MRRITNRLAIIVPDREAVYLLELLYGMDKRRFDRLIEIIDLERLVQHPDATLSKPGFSVTKRMRRP
jgi:hypothetical protein